MSSSKWLRVEGESTGLFYLYIPGGRLYRTIAYESGIANMVFVPDNTRDHHKDWFGCPTCVQNYNHVLTSQERIAHLESVLITLAHTAGCSKDHEHGECINAVLARR